MPQYKESETLAVYECVFDALTGKFPNGGFDVMLEDTGRATAVQSGAWFPGARVLTNVDIGDFGPDCNLADFEDAGEFAQMARHCFGRLEYTDDASL